MLYRSIILFFLLFFLCNCSGLKITTEETVKNDNDGSWQQAGPDIIGEIVGSLFGTSVSINSDGSVVAVGAPFVDGNGWRNGCVRIYQNNGGSWIQTGNIIGEAKGDQFGQSVSLSADGTIIAIGAPTDGYRKKSGYVRIYHNNNGAWSLIGNSIQGESTTDQSGYSVAISSDGSIVAVGIPYPLEVDGFSYSVYGGRVRIYKNINENWTQIGKYIDGNLAFGSSVDLSSDGSTVIIGAPKNDSPGYANIYKNISGSWNQVGSSLNGESSNDFFGCSVSINSDGSIVAIGAPYSHSGGYVKIYKNNDGIWSQLNNSIYKEAGYGNFGYSVSLNSNGSIIAIGDPDTDNDGVSGYVRIFKNNNGYWAQIENDINGETSTGSFGYSASINADGSIVAIGAPYNEAVTDSLGRVRIYQSNAKSCVQMPDIDGEAANDGSGYSLSLSSDGSVIAIGATYNDGNNHDAGHVRIYQNKHNTCSWSLIGKDIDGEAANDHSGQSVSLNADGSTVAVGALRNDGNGPDAGCVKVYKNNADIWTQAGNNIDGEAANDLSGFSVSLSSVGSIVAIGAIMNDGNGTDSGHVRIYENIESIWKQRGEDIDGEFSGDHFGCSLSLSSDGLVVAVGAADNDGNGSSAGHARIYKYNDSIWNQIGEDIDGETSGDFFGVSVSLNADGSIVAIGGDGNSEKGREAGHVRIYQNISGIWTQIGNDIDGKAAGDNLGYAVSLNSKGSVVAIGAKFHKEERIKTGQVRVFKNIDSNWVQIGNDINGETAMDKSGFSVSLNSKGTVVAIGAPGNNGNGSNSGHVRVYQIINGVWTLIREGLESSIK